MRIIRIYSDIHQELRNDDNLFNIEVSGNEKNQILILAGDIDQLKNYKNSIRMQWLENLCQRFSDVLYVFGNHEYYRGKIGNIYNDKNINLFSHIGNLHILSRHTQSVTIGNVKFVGASLWTPLKNVGFLDHNLVNDVKSIKSVNGKGYTKFGTETWRNENELDFDWIKKEISSTDGDVVVITHHAPVITEDPRDKIGKYTHHNCSELDDFISKNKNIKVWIHGHVHQASSKSRKIGETKIFSNTIGGKLLYDDPERSLLTID